MLTSAVHRRDVLLGAALAGTARPLAAQEAWPTRPIRVLIGAGPGGTTDILARLLAPSLGELLGQNLVVENRAGAGGTIAAEALARSRPDGHTAMLLNNAHAAAAAIFRRLPYDSIADFAPATILATSPLVLLTSPSGPLSNLGSVLAAARERPEALSVATVGVGTTQHFVTAALEAAAGIRFTHIPYPTTPAALIALRAGEVQAVMETVSAVLGPARSGDVRPVAVSSAARSPVLPDVPTMAEGGLPGFDLSTWYVLAFAAATPAPILSRTSTGAARTLTRPEIRQQLLNLGLEPVGSDPEAARDLVRRQVARAVEIRSAAGIPQQ